MARAIRRLTALAVSRAKRPGKYPDGAGLYLQVSAGGARSWIFRYMLDGTEREMGLGSLLAVTLAEARIKATEARKLRAEGIDPIESRHAQRSAARLDAAHSVTFEDAAAAFIAAHRAGWRNAEHARQWETTLATYAEPFIGALPVQAIDTGLVMRVLEPIWSTKTETAGRLRGRIESILDWAKVRGHRTGENPARWRGHLDKLLPAPSKVAKVKHHAALAYDALPAFMVALRAQDGVGARALEFLILTAARAGEVAGAQWGEIDLAGKVWTVPAGRMKAGKEHRVPLPARALAILANRGTEGLIFPSTRKCGKPLPRKAMRNLLERMTYSKITVHGFRSTFRDWAADCTSFSSEVVEMALAHAIRDSTEAAYRRSDLFEKRRALMQQWGSFCDQQAGEADARVTPSGRVRRKLGMRQICTSSKRGVTHSAVAGRERTLAYPDG